MNHLDLNQLICLIQTRHMVIMTYHKGFFDLGDKYNHQGHNNHLINRKDYQVNFGFTVDPH